MINWKYNTEVKPGTSSEYSFYIYFALQFLLVALGAFFNIKTGILTLLLTFVAIPIILGRCSAQEFDMSRGKNAMTFIYIILGLFYILQLSNPNNVQDAWNVAIAHYWLYPFVLAITVPIAIRSERGIEYLLIIWATFIILATLKGYIQKSYGFSEKDRYFLYVLGGQRTHIIWSGIRYFSFFSDAANFGVNAAMGATTLGLSSFFVRGKWLKLYLIFSSLCGLYCIAISGTRAAVVIPMSGLLMFSILSRKWKALIGSLALVVGVFCFFYYTHIGSGNQYIYKIRSTFHPTKDASYNLRIENRERMKAYMKERPFGFGLGLSKGERYNPKSLMPYPPDSWWVSVWVETGIIGLILYFTAHAILFAWCSWLLLFKVQSARLRGLLASWLSMSTGYFVAAYANDVMQYPNSIPVYTGLALCFAATYIDRTMKTGKHESKVIDSNKNKAKDKYKLYNPLK